MWYIITSMYQYRKNTFVHFAMSSSPYRAYLLVRNKPTITRAEGSEFVEYMISKCAK